MNIRFNFAGNFLSSVNIARRIYAAKCSDEIFIKIPWFSYLANLHQCWIERFNHSPIFVPIPFPCRSIAHLSRIIWYAFRQLPRCRILTPAMPTQTWAPPVGTAAAKERSYNRDADELAGRGRGWCLLRGRPRRRRHTQRRGRARCGTWPWLASSWQRSAPPARTGVLPPGTWQRPAPAVQRWGRVCFLPGSLYACCKAANWKKGPETKLCMPQKWQTCMYVGNRLRDRFAGATFRAEARFRFNQSIITYFTSLNDLIFKFIFTSFLFHYYELELPLLHHYYPINGDHYVLLQ